MRHLWMLFAFLTLACSGSAFEPMFAAAGAPGAAGTPGAAGQADTGGAPGAGAGGRLGTSTGGAGGDPVASGGSPAGGTATGGSTHVGGAPSTGGAPSGGAPSGGTGGSTGGTGGAATGGSGTGGSTCKVTEAVASVLPAAFSWSSYGSNANTGSGIACAKCTTAPCGNVDIAWGDPIQTATDTVLVPVLSSSACVPGLYGACPPTAGCTLCLNAQASMIVTLKIAPSGRNYVVQGVTVSGAWTLGGSCSYTSNDAASSTADSSLTTTLTGLLIPCGG